MLIFERGIYSSDSQLEAILPPRPHLAVSGDILVVTTEEMLLASGR